MTLMRLQLVALAWFAALPCALDAQAVTGFASAVGSADLLYFAGRPEEAYAMLLEHLEAAPSDYDALWRAARAAVVVGITEGEVGAPQNRWFDPAILLGDRAVAERPEGIDGLYWRGAAEGRRALNAGPDYSAELAQRVYDDAHAILAIAPDHGGAHNLLGKLSFEIMSLSRMERFLGRVLTRQKVLSDSSWESAEEHLVAATERWPDMVLFQFDLAQLYLKRGRKDAARAALHRVTEIVPLHPPDATFQEHARRDLEQLDS